MLNWHWVYRDFVLASLKSQNSDQWLQEVQQAYFDAHERLLDEIHFTPKGFPTKQEVRKRIESLGSRRYEKLLHSIGSDFERFEQRLRSMVNRLLEELTDPEADQDIYVIVGLDCTNIYSTSFGGSAITVLCLEATDGDFDALELLLAHECHHWKRQQQTAHDIFDTNLGERMVSEGLASYFSQEIQPGRAISEYCYVPDSTVDWVLHHWELLHTLHDDFDTDRLMSAFFSRTPHQQIVSGMPPRTGYVYGYLIVREFLVNTQQTALNMAGVPWEAVMKRYC